MIWKHCINWLNLSLYENGYRKVYIKMDWTLISEPNYLIKNNVTSFPEKKNNLDDLQYTAIKNAMRGTTYVL